MMAQSKRGNGSRRGRHRGNWTEDHMKEAIMEVKKGAVSIAKIGEKFGIPETSIRDWMSGKTSSKKRGPRTVLTEEEETAIVDWCLEMQRNGHSITFYMLRRKVADVCQGRETPFKNGVPGKSWMDWFRKRHPNVMIEAAHALKGKKRNDSEREILGGKRTKASPMGPAVGMIGRGEEASVRRDLFGAAGSEPSGMEPHDPRDIMSQLMQQETHIDAHSTTPRRMDGVNGEETTPDYDPWKGHERSEAGGATSESDGSESYPSSTSSGGRRKWFEVTEGIAGIERAIRESEDRKDRRLERQLEANDRIAAGFIGALSHVADSLRTLGQRGLGGGGLGGGLGGLGGLGALGGLGGHQS